MLTDPEGQKISNLSNWKGTPAELLKGTSLFPIRKNGLTHVSYRDVKDVFLIFWPRIVYCIMVIK